MVHFQTKIRPNLPNFSENIANMIEKVEQLRELESRAVKKSSQRQARFDERGQIPPHERIARLLDPGMPFLKLHTLASYLVDDPNPETSIPGANVIAGIGFVEGIRCLIWVDDSGISAGAMTKMTLAKILSIQEIARRQKLPVIHLVESAGANLLNWTKEAWVHSGGMFRNLSQLSAAGIPNIVVLHGPSTAGGAYMVGLADYVIGVKKNGLAALAGAALVKAATGEEVDDRELGGTEMHAQTSGLVEFLAEDDAHALSIARSVVANLDWNKRGRPVKRPDFDPPVYSSDELLGIVSTDYKVPFDMREVIARIVDGSKIEEFKPRYGAATVCVQTSIMGMSCGIIGNNGPIDPQGATKAAQFFQLCDQSERPIIFLQNTTGYIVGTDSEQAGMIKHGAKMIQAVSNVSVPKITLHISASFGAGNYGMCGYAYEPDFLFFWPNASSNVMGGEQAAGTMRMVMEAAAKRRGKTPDYDTLDKKAEDILNHFNSQESAFYSAGRLLNHGIIDPRDTRRVLGFCLETCLESGLRTLKPNSFGVARF